MKAKTAQGGDEQRCKCVGMVLILEMIPGVILSLVVVVVNAMNDNVGVNIISTIKEGAVGQFDSENVPS